MKKDPYASEDFTEKYLELSKLPEPLRLAAGLEETMQWPLHGKAADCLRRLHEENERMRAALEQQQAAQWVGLDDEEIDLLINGRGDEDDDDYVEPTGDGFGVTDADLKALVRRADAKLREKNGGKA